MSNPKDIEKEQSEMIIIRERLDKVFQDVNDKHKGFPYMAGVELYEGCIAIIEDLVEKGKDYAECLICHKKYKFNAMDSETPSICNGCLQSDSQEKGKKLDQEAKESLESVLEQYNALEALPWFEAFIKSQVAKFGKQRSDYEATIKLSHIGAALLSDLLGLEKPIKASGREIRVEITEI